MDACSMSTIEYASQLHGIAECMVASQEEVSDLSFPYDTLLTGFRRYGSNVKTLCEKSVTSYMDAYQDYITDLQTGMKPCTLSALDLQQLDEVLGPSEGDEKKSFPIFVETLRTTLAKNRDLEQKILEARAKSQGFVGGLFVDLADFCDKLMKELGEKQPRLNKACKVVSQSIKTPGKVVLANEVAKTAKEKVTKNAENEHTCHGLSIYFPYFGDREEKDDQFRIVANPKDTGRSERGKGPGAEQDIGGKSVLSRQEIRVKGPGAEQDTGGKGPGAEQDTGGKGPGAEQDIGGKGRDIANLAARSVLYSVRWQLIKDTENYYPELEFAKTGWYDFIQRDWSTILAKHRAHQINVRYSAEQCAINLFSIVEGCRSGRAAGLRA
jgi:hypothetical protein